MKWLVIKDEFVKYFFEAGIYPICISLRKRYVTFLCLCK